MSLCDLIWAVILLTVLMLPIVLIVGAICICLYQYDEHNEKYTNIYNTKLASLDSS